MATLNIKNFPEDLYQKIRRQAAREHRSLAQQVIHLLSQGISPRRRRKHSILELQGLGKEIWKGIDATEHIDRERNSWD